MPDDFWDDLVAEIWHAESGPLGRNPVLTSIWFDVLVAEHGHLAVGAALSNTAPATPSRTQIAAETAHGDMPTM